MIYSTSDDVPEVWDSIIQSFVTVVEHDIEFNKGVPINNLQFAVKRGLLFITYEGGSKITDAFAAFAREISSTICYSCGSVADRIVFGSPKCEDCD